MKCESGADEWKTIEATILEREATNRKDVKGKKGSENANGLKNNWHFEIVEYLRGAK